MRRWIAGWMTICLGLGVAQAVQLPEAPLFVQMTHADGLPSTYVNALEEDAAGYLWVATQDGLARYDGVEFTIYRHAVDDATTLPGNAVQVLHVDAHAPGAPVHLPDGAPWPARSELIGLVCATHVAASVRLDSDGAGEALHFLDGHGAPLASLWLLPDSDFLVWEALIAHLPTMPMPQSGWQCGQCAALRARARVCCFQSIRVTRGTWLDAVAPTRLSGIGQMRARRLAQAAGASLLV